MVRRLCWLLSLFGVGCAQPPPPPAQAPPGAAPRQAPPATASASPAPAPAPASAAPAPPPFPGVACADAQAEDRLRFFACSSDCERRDAAGCEALGDLHAREEGLPQPVGSAGPALRAWGAACELGISAACEKRDRLRAALAEACRKQPGEACVVEGNAVVQLAGEARREEADASYQRACSAGFGDGCAESAALHEAWQPAAQHQPIAERLYAKACRLGSAMGCCAMLVRHQARGDQRAIADLQRRTGLLTLGCGAGGPPAPLPPPGRVQVTLPPESAALLGEPERELFVRSLTTRARGCYARAADASARWKGRVTLGVEVDAEGRVTAAEVGTKQRAPDELLQCLRQSSLRVELRPSSAPRRLAAELELAPPP